MSTDDRAAVRERLLAERAELADRIAALDAELDAVAAAVAGSNVDDEHDPEGSTVAFEREQLAAVRDQARGHLPEIDAALGRVEDGSYGSCETCREPMAAERLAALPATRFCVRCASARRS